MNEIEAVASILERALVCYFFIDPFFVLPVIIIINLLLSYLKFGFNNKLIHIINMSSIVIYILQYFKYFYDGYKYSMMFDKIIINSYPLPIFLLILLIFIIYIRNCIFLDRNIIAYYIKILIIYLLVQSLLFLCTDKLDIFAFVLMLLSLPKLFYIAFNINILYNHINNRFVRYLLLTFDILFIVFPIWFGIEIFSDGGL